MTITVTKADNTSETFNNVSAVNIHESGEITVSLLQKNSTEKTSIINLKSPDYNIITLNATVDVAPVSTNNEEELTDDT